MNKIGLVLKGAAMGIAEVIPGVSGGTIALITGIYQELINSIKAFDFELIGLLKNGDFAKAWSHINGRFLVFLIGFRHSSKGQHVSSMKINVPVEWLIDTMLFGDIISDKIQYCGQQF